MRMQDTFIFKVILASCALVTGAQAAPGQRYDVQRNDTKIHAFPSAKARVLGRLNRGDRVIEWRRNGAWVEVSPMGVVGANGWVHFSRLRSEASEIEIEMAPDGHFYADVQVNGTAIRFLIDTGATNVALTPDDARKVGLNVDDLKFTRRVRTANGVTLSAPVVLDEISIGLLTVRKVRGGVNKGKLDTSLLGLAFLRRLRGYEVVGDRLLLRW
ncbi:MAG: TIGR02281 family clan AA aspartic protease [Alphaproteobacteria bacterium]|nr:TIGR02281 family clan AA aspartic protease [Alphaproteobacteria bacterium]